MESKLHQRIAAEIRADMARKKITQSTLMEALLMTQPSLSKRLTGERPFTLSEMEKVCGVLRIAPNELLRRANDVDLQAAAS
ncbi:helix-turn-helix domain-containing protein [Subtercola sp. YIM 133946]|uniref:helix-turn-helix domain-containing protein n=1 Tax=Subtercola sp. YIM 133946 TaxID=3118909 RepID=UPI002F92D8C5